MNKIIKEVIKESQFLTTRVKHLVHKNPVT